MTKKKEITEAEVPAVREGLIRDANGLLRDAQGRLLPGQRSVNPAGTSKMEQLLESLPDDFSLDQILALRLGKRGAIKLADSLIQLATGQKASLQAIQYIYDRLEGKPKQSITETKDATPEFMRVMERFFEQQNEPTKTVGPTVVNGLPARTGESVIEAAIREVSSEEPEA